MKSEGKKGQEETTDEEGMCCREETGKIIFSGVMQRGRRTITGNPGLTSNVKNANAERGNK